ncbi:MAG TPA: FAD-dependent oxidoreductase [Candidatus Saccharimonadales bacterium]|nr:FAD-dependent oxidoreductase [Candidatus Saccharimonadales bacterium]
MKLKYVDKEKEVENVYSFIFESSKKVSWQPGQYLHYELPHPDTDDRGIERWFTISAPSYEKNIMLTTRFDSERSSTFKKALQKLEPGQEVEAGEPRGDFLLEPDASRHVLIAGGIGVTPYHSMLLQLDHDGKLLNIDLLYANRDDNFVFDDEFQKLAAKHPEFKIHKFIGNQRITENDLKPYLENESVIFYISGPRPMVETYQHLLEDLDVTPERIKTDYFPGYQLG